MPGGHARNVTWRRKFSMFTTWSENGANVSSLPAVMAVWAAKPEVVHPEGARGFYGFRAISGWLRSRRSVEEAARELDLPQPALESYLRHNIDFSLR